jgi:hypothetical protein
MLFTFLIKGDIVLSQNDNYDGISGEFDDLIDAFKSSYDNASNPLSIGKNDIRFVRGDKYIDMYVRQKGNINSVLIIYVVEEEIERKKVNVDYGLRALEYNTVNGDEIRVLNNVALGKEQGLYFLVDSTPEADKEFGKAFIIRIPTYVQYGYTKENFGLVRIDEGSEIKLRTFELPYADYSGKYHDTYITISSVGLPKVDLSGRPILKFDPKEDDKPFTDNFIWVYVKYEDDGRFFKNFLMREYLIVESKYKPIPFKVEDIPENNNAILLYSIYQDGKKTVKAKIYFERQEKERKIEISAMDSDGNRPVEDLVVKVPRIGGEIDDIYDISNVPGN